MAIGKAKSLVYLNVDKNQIDDDGFHALSPLEKLRTLSIRGNKLSSAPAFVETLRNLKLTAIDAEDNFLRWRVSDRPFAREVLSTRIPLELINRVVDAKEGEGVGYAGAVIIGPGWNGKSQLVRWLTNHPKKLEPIGEDDRTWGIATAETILNDLRLVILDCGGQVEQLATHTNLVVMDNSRSIYILCLRADRDFEKNLGWYYLGLLQEYRKHLLGVIDDDAAPREQREKVPVIILVTFGDTGHPRPIDANFSKGKFATGEYFMKRFPWLDVLVVPSYKGMKGHKISDVQDRLSEHTRRMPQTRVTITETMGKVRDRIRECFEAGQSEPDNDTPQIKTKILTRENYLNLYEKVAGQDHSQAESTLLLLHNLNEAIAPGIHLTTRPENRLALEDAVSCIYNPRFVNFYLYQRILRDGKRVHQHGFLSNKQLASAMKGLELFEKDLLVKLLRDNLLAFDWTTPDRVNDRLEGLLVPDLLVPRQLPANWSRTAAVVAWINFEQWVSETVFFRFLANLNGRQMLQPLELTPEEKLSKFRHTGVFRDECRVVNATHGCEALVHFDVIKLQVFFYIRPVEVDRPKVDQNPYAMAQDLGALLREVGRLSKPSILMFEKDGRGEFDSLKHRIVSALGLSSDGLSKRELMQRLNVGSALLQRALTTLKDKEHRVAQRGNGPAAKWVCI